MIFFLAFCFSCSGFGGSFWELIAQSESARMKESGNLLVAEVNEAYDRLANHTTSEELSDARIYRSLWAKKTFRYLVEHRVPRAASELEWSILLWHLFSLRTVVAPADIEVLLATQRKLGSPQTRSQLAWLLSQQGDAGNSLTRATVADLGGPSGLLRMGPPVVPGFVPIRIHKKYRDHAAWFDADGLSAWEFIDGDPDRVRIRGMELRSGDIGAVEVNHLGDGVLEGFLEDVGVVPHAMLFVTLRRKLADGKTVYLPAMMEIFQGGVRCVPAANALSPGFSWYSQWSRPRGLPADTGERLSREVQQLKGFSFDFQARPTPPGGHFPNEPGQPCSTCTNLIHVPFERAGIHLPYTATKVAEGARANLSILGIDNMREIYTPTDILNRSGFQHVGVVDNAEPENAIAQALAAGRPEQVETLGGRMSQRRLVPENLPSPYSIARWRSSVAAAVVSLGQSNGAFGNWTRKIAGMEKEEVPLSGSPTMISFYFLSDLIASDAAKAACPLVLSLLGDSSHPRLSELRNNPQLLRTIDGVIEKSVMGREQWYGRP